MLLGFFNLLKIGMWFHQFGSSIKLSPSSEMVTQRTLTVVDPFLWRLVRSRFSRCTHTEGLLAHLQPTGRQPMGFPMGRRCLCVWARRQDTHTLCAFVDIRKASDTSWIEATLVRLHSLASQVAGAQLPTFSLRRSPRCEFEETSRFRGWTLGPHRGACFHPCQSLGKEPCGNTSRLAGVRLVPSPNFRLTAQLHADDLSDFC